MQIQFYWQKEMVEPTGNSHLAQAAAQDQKEEGEREPGKEKMLGRQPRRV